MYIKVNNVNLYYEVIGKGKPLIMIHGNGEDHETFFELADSLKNKFKIYLIDSRNHGKSQKDLDISFDLMADDIITFCDKLMLDKVYFLGFSDGGIVGLKIAIKRPYLAYAMILCGANYKPKGVKKDFYKKIKKDFKQNKSPLLKLMISEPKFRKNDLKNIKVKIIFIAGEHDLIKQSHTMKLSRLIKDSIYYILENETHESYIMHSDKLKSYVLLLKNAKGS
jgi:pimeloyl-ACP methyl ester carboxylesterase